MYVRVINGKAISYAIDNLFSEYPNVSFPRPLTPEFLSRYNIYKAYPSPVPEYNPLTQNAILSGFINVNGKWTQHWQVVDLPTDVQIANIKNARAQEYREVSDPLFFKAQRGEIDITVWESKVYEIKDKYPYPDGIEE